MPNKSSADRPGLLDRLEQGSVICAEGYVFELERRGYVQAGPFVPEVVLDHPEALAELHREFARAGSDVIEAFTYYGHREKMRVVGREEDLEALNRQALQIAKEVADENGQLVAGNVCNTNFYAPDDSASHDEVRAMFEEQVGWAADGGVDMVIGETFPWLGEALIALEVIKDAGLPAVITLAIFRQPETFEGVKPSEACRELEERGADVVGLNCARGPATMLPLLEPIRDAVDGYVAGLPIPYRTHPDEPTFYALTDAGSQVIPNGRPFPTALDPFTCNRYEVAEFAKSAESLGINYIGLCCGAAPHHIRSVAEALGRTPPASRYSTDLSKHGIFGTDASVRKGGDVAYDRY